MMKRVGVLFSLCWLLTIHDMRGFGPPDSQPSETGNWYEKLQWWHKAKPMSDKIADRVDDCIEYKNELAEKAARAFPRINELYVDLGVSAEEILKKIEAHEALSRQQRDEAENAGEEDELARIQKNEAVLQELKNNVDLLTLIAKRLEEVMRQAASIEQTIESYEVQSLRVYKRISGEAEGEDDEIFDDQEAHRLYKQLQNCYENVDHLAAHLDGPLRMYVGSMLARISSVSTSVLSLVQELEREELYIKPIVEPEKPKEKSEEKEKAPVEKVERKEPKKGFFRRIADYFGSFF